MVPLKSQISPQRPSFDRNHSAPISPTRQHRPEYQTRSSFDQLTADRPGWPASSSSTRSRVSSFSTPPQAMFDSPGASGSASSMSRLNPFKGSSAAPNKASPTLRSRRSDDMLRKSEDVLRPADESYTKKELKAMQREAQRNLGVATPIPVSNAEKAGDDSRKSSGLSLKKSSGALKALFKSKGKDKETSTPPVPGLASRSVSESVTDSRPSLDVLNQPSFSRAKSPAIPQLATSEFGGKRTSQQERAASQPVARSSFSTERALYPTHPRAKEIDSRRSEDWARSIRENTSSPQPPPRRPSASSQGPDLPRASSSPVPEGSRTQQPLLADALHLSSLPYLNSMAGGSNADSPVAPSTSRLGRSSGLTPPHSPPQGIEATAPETPSPLFKPSRSLHLLALPDLDLNFDLSFDKLGQSSPGTPRRSPRKTPRPGMSGFSSPTRSLSTSSKATARPSPVKRTASSNERRRSKSFDGPVPGPDLWTDGGFALPTRLFASNTSSSAPLLSAPLELSISDDANSAASERVKEDTQAIQPVLKTPQEYVSKHTYADSYSSQPSAPSSSDYAHARTPSNASSTNETSSPSPPRTPEEEKSHTAPRMGDLLLTEKSSQTMKLGRQEAKQPSSSQTSLLGAAIELSTPPSIPLPALPSLDDLAGASAVPPLLPIKSDKDLPGLTKPRTKVWKLQSKGRIVMPESDLGNKALTREIDRLLLGFRYPVHGDWFNHLKMELLPLLLEIERRPLDPKEEPAYAALRQSMFEWADALLVALQKEQTANERGACLEALAAIIESSVFSERALGSARGGRDTVKFTGLMMRVMGFVMAKLGAKGVFHNTLLFSGRFLAFAFFRIPHISEQLVTVLQPPRGALMRFTRAAMMGPQVPPSAQPRYPEHLLPLCFDNARAYTARLATLSPEFSSMEERDAFLFQPGNWLRRWQSDDSELFPAFYRAYHRQLTQYLSPAIEHFESLNQPLPASSLLRAPGYAHLATIFAKKCQSYILGSVNAVTTSSAVPSFEATETAGFRGSQKPPVLETANRRLVETMSTFSNARMMVTNTRGRIVEYDGSMLWTSMIDLWTKSIITKTSLFAPKGVFSLFDLLDGIVDPPYNPTTGMVSEAILDVPHLIYVIRIILTQGEHALTLVKAVAFVFTHWEVLTADADDRRELCLDLLLKRDLFERLCLFWSQSVRSYVLRLVVFRLGHIHTKKEDGLSHDVEIESVQLLQARLDKIRKRYTQLEPRSAEAEADKDFALNATAGESALTRSRSTITMVADTPHSGTGSANKAEKLLGLGFGQIDKDDEARRASTSSGASGKASSWFKKLGGGGKNKKKAAGQSTPPTRSPASENTPVFATSPAVEGKLPPMRNSSKLASVVEPVQPMGSPTTSTESADSPRERKAPPPLLQNCPTALPAITLDMDFGSDSGHSGENTSSNTNTNTNGSNNFAFEFELPTTSPRSDNFDPPAMPPSPRRHSQPPSPRQPTSPHMSRSFSKRSSLLPPQTARELDNMLASGGMGTPSPVDVKKEKERLRREEGEVGYEKRLHPYAVRMLAELEDAQKEYDEWWSDGGVGKVDGAPPRLTVAWPFHEGEE